MLENKLINEPIISGKSAAGINIGDDEIKVLNLWGKPLEIKDSFDTRWIKYDIVEFAIDLSNDNKVKVIRLKKGYKGKTKEGFGIGVTDDEIIKAGGKFNFDDDDNDNISVHYEGFEGIYFSSAWNDNKNDTIYETLFIQND